MSEGGEAGIASQQEVEQLQTVEEINAKLVRVLQKRDRALEQVISFPVASVLFKCPNSQLESIILVNSQQSIDFRF
ncbi:hypothetical protein QUB70_26285 [Microcoleus sp. A003_D6]|uniref:hypothetical protein n=1 Tax=Microcoleus sp. A003_D6 TaxID=3055266 RepID=UPI002FD00482